MSMQVTMLEVGLITKDNPMDKIEATPDGIADAVNSIKGTVQKITIRGTIQIGRLLAEAKKMIPRGEWTGWLQDHVAYSVRTAQYAMEIAEKYGKMDEDRLSKLSYSAAISIIGLTEEERLGIIDSMPKNAKAVDYKAAAVAIEQENREKQQAIEGLKEELEKLKKEKSATYLDWIKEKSKREAAEKTIERERLSRETKASAADTLAEENRAKDAQLKHAGEQIEKLQEALEKARQAEKAVGTIYEDSPETLKTLEALKQRNETVQAVTLISESFRRCIAELEQMGIAAIQLKDANQRWKVMSKLLGQIKSMADDVAKTAMLEDSKDAEA
ncbi:MAG: DUF3102 domain-containing protein [Succinivibrionaceae bacterium]|nr:DUF3102 domain-containing protein [Succinivibrionaceae bacterium]